MDTKTLSAAEKWEQATLANNFIFYKVMRHHPNACQHLIEMLLNIQIEKFEIRNEETIELDYGDKGIRLDVFVKDTDRMYDIEIQATDTKELPERSRYYQGLMELDSLEEGKRFKDLKDSHVIFICMDDIFKDKLPVYTFENLCLENKTTKLNDRTCKHFFIATICARMIEDEELKTFFEFLISNRAVNDFTNDLKGYVIDAKHNMQWRTQFMEWERQRTYDFDAGKEAGAQQKAIEDARSFYSNGASIELIAKSLNMTIARVKEIVNNTVSVV